MNYIDLFAGAGGLSEGFIKAGFKPIAHVEMEANACLTLKTRAAYHYLKSQGQLDVYYSYLKQEIDQDELYSNIPDPLLRSIIQAEISDLSIKTLFNRIDKLLHGEKIDLIVGGPPCQAYSTVGRSKINSLENQHFSTDRRYNLYKHYGMFLKHYQPDYFVFENVLGILSADNKQLIKQIERHFAKECGYKIRWQVLDANKYGVLQLRKRVIIIGKRGLEPFDYPEPETVTRQADWTVKNALLADLEYLNPGDERPITSYTTDQANTYLTTTGIRNVENFVTQHITRPHNDRDLTIYRMAIDKWKERNRLKYTDVPEELRTHKNLNAFLDRYKVVDPNGLSHTVVAHLSKDGHYYIYPDENQVRSLSVREAARIQSFPDDYYFEGGRNNAFKQIGNAVPPLLAYAVANKLKEILSVNDSNLHCDSISRTESVIAY